jgi:hypothetical protein
MKRRPRVEKACEECGETFHALRYLHRRGEARFCGIRCASRGKRKPRQDGPLNSNWKGGVAKDNVRYKMRFRERYPVKAAAHDAVKDALRAGKLTRQPCEVCGKPRGHAHHDDYRKPLEVRWLCRDHHLEWHRHNTAIGGGKPPMKRAEAPPAPRKEPEWKRIIRERAELRARGVDPDRATG